MKINHIAIFGENRIVAKDGEQPFTFGEDRKRFEELTTGHPLIVGRKTFESFPFVLPDRQLIVLTRQKILEVDHRTKGGDPLRCYIKHGQSICKKHNGRRYGISSAGSISEAFTLADGYDIYIGGGAEVYDQTLEYVHQLRLTYVRSAAALSESTKTYPDFEDNWREICRDDRGAYSFVDFVREES